MEVQMAGSSCRPINYIGVCDVLRIMRVSASYKISLYQADLKVP